MTLNDNPVGSFGDGRQTVSEGGKAVALATGTACSWVTIEAETDNTGEIVVGGSSVVAELAKRRGLSLAKGDSVTLPAGNLTSVYIDATVNGDGVSFIYGIA